MMNVFGYLGVTASATVGLLSRITYLTHNLSDEFVWRTLSLHQILSSIILFYLFWMFFFCPSISTFL